MPEGAHPKKYGGRVTLERLTDQYLCLKTLEKNIGNCFYQVQVRHKHFPDLLNVVVIVKTNITTGKATKVLLFSGDLDLAYDKLVEQSAREEVATAIAAYCDARPDGGVSLHLCTEVVNR